ncbi:hypothetical protein JDV09_16370 [Mycobacterium sp. Y57]|uniref:Rv1733c family protein n=1 Tax=Mycolicibacterium xanthum TaxID=2796469 RepID=UPI001C85DAF8|nr:hypothetical protein [Mycolicibacterium xanthum]MBX7433673.1 hypothetical protein [Mycolicibacterium xanthum]
MQNFTFGPGTWLTRLLTRHPLVRASDRIEAAAVVLIVMVALLALPVAAVIGTAAKDDLTHAFAADRLDRQQIVAVVDAESTSAPQVYGPPFVTTIRWEFAGSEHSAVLRTGHMNSGDPVTIWIDAAGRRTTPPRTDRDAGADAVLIALAVWGVAVGGAGVVFAVVKLRLDRLRGADWDRELEDLAGDGGRTNNA